ncbi:MAG: S46 family peptidase [Bacteroidia bacterium]|nr:S46 family peptidase [Bacteroidia bacterium]
MKKIIIALLVSILTIGTTIADEGMWLPMLLKNNYAQMQKMGLKLTPEQLYDLNHSSLKDAIVWFNGGCTSEIISEQGLLLTNHHCGYDAIAKHSTTADNILDNGFWAKSFAEEKENAGMWASVLVRMEDVSDKVNKALEGVDAKNIDSKKAEIFKSIEKDAKKDTHYEASVKSFFKDNAYYLFVFEKFTDIRLVAAPPQNIGKFGGDTDNWMWPRHTADFSMFRIYANKDNAPAAYSKDNVPYKPKQFLNISNKGIKEGDFTMVYGFPGRTNRYENSFGIKLATDKVSPAIVALRDVRLTEWKNEMDKSDSVRLLLSSNYARVANYWKYYIGQTEQLKRLKVYEEKLDIEKQFKEWAKNKQEYASILPNFEQAYANYDKYALHSTYIREGIMGSALITKAMKFMSLEKALSADKPDPEQIKKAVDALKIEGEEFYKSFNPISEEKILAKITQMYFENIAVDQQPGYMAVLMKKYKGKTNKETFEKFAKAAFENSVMVSKQESLKFLEKPNLKKLKNDPAFAYAKACYTNYIERILPHVEEFDKINNAEGNKYIKALMEMQPNKNFYPDANSTIRLTYGSVKAYAPKDGVDFKYYTTLDGVMEKENPKEFEFQVPAKLKDLYAKKDFGRYADTNGEMRVGFISNNDITGGNSGSPVINGDGELVGLAFDGNWEAMSGDIYFDSKYKRTISCDIRYVLFLIDKFGGASNLIKEMNIKN